MSAVSWHCGLIAPKQKVLIGVFCAGSFCEAGQWLAECAFGHQRHRVPLDVLPAADGQQPGFPGKGLFHFSLLNIVFFLFCRHCVYLTKTLIITLEAHGALPQLQRCP